MRLVAVVGWLLVSLACGGGAPDAGQTPPDALAEGEGVRTEHILVQAEGYKPDTIQVSPGEKIRLVFTRPDAANCGEELVFPESGRKVDLPVGVDTEVILTAPESGKVAFTCGMGMYQGAVVVGG